MEVFPAFKAKYVDTGQGQLHAQGIPDRARGAGRRRASCWPAAPARTGTSRCSTPSSGARARWSRPATIRRRAAAHRQGARRPDRRPVQRLHEATRPPRRRWRRGSTAHVQGRQDRARTPTFVINGKRFEGEMTLPELDAAIAEATGLGRHAHDRRLALIAAAGARPAAGPALPAAPAGAVPGDMSLGNPKAQDAGDRVRLGSPARTAPTSTRRCSRPSRRSTSTPARSATP